MKSVHSGMKQAFPGAQMAAQYVFFLEVEGGIYIYIIYYGWFVHKLGIS